MIDGRMKGKLTRGLKDKMKPALDIQAAWLGSTGYVMYGFDSTMSLLEDTWPMHVALG